MIDIKLIRENRALVKENIKKKFQDYKIPFVDEIYDLDVKWRKEKAQLDALRAERNKISQLINEEKKAGKDVSLLLQKAKQIPDEIAKIEKYADSLQSAINERLLKIPNIISDKTPIGKDENDNVVIKRWGKIPKFKFPLLNHVEIAEKQGFADFDASAKVAGMDSTT